MINQITSFLMKKKVEYLIQEFKESSYELFFVGNTLQMNRAKDTHSYSVTVYHSHNGFKGSATLSIHPTMNKEELTERNTCEISKHIYLQYGEKFEWPVNNENKNLEKIFCYGSVDQFGILVDGTVTACCLDSDGMINFGNIYENSFKEIIESEKFKTFNKKIKDGLCASALCSNCTYARKKV